MELEAFFLVYEFKNIKLVPKECLVCEEASRCVNPKII